MLESKDFRKGIHMLEWERRRLEMEIQDLCTKSQEIQMLKLSRELQAILVQENKGTRQYHLDKFISSLSS